MKNIRLVFLLLSYISILPVALSQVSNIDELLPLDGVVIPRTQSNQQQIFNPLAVFKDCDECPEMVVIPSGSFLMGSPPDTESPPIFSKVKPEKIGKMGEDNEKPQHLVHIQSFAMGKYPITQEQWFAVMGNNPSVDIGSTRPVQRVSWTDAHLFIKKLTKKTGYTYRLPSEAEWEYATKAGTTTQFFWGDNDTQIYDYVWSYYDKLPVMDFQPVGLKKPNQFGLFDLQSSILQWTQDCWNENYIGAPTDGSAWTTGDCSKRVLRGSPMMLNRLEMFRSARRNSASPDFGFIRYRFGFRVVRDL